MKTVKSALLDKNILSMTNDKEKFIAVHDYLEEKEKNLNNIRESIKDLAN